jgi:hypothetical protein
MQVVKLEHFTRAAEEIGKHGDNDTLPFNMDNRFISEKATQLASIAFGYFERLNKSGKKAAANELNSLQIFNERLLTHLQVHMALEYLRKSIRFGTYT